jgi:hypothetical protein
VEEYIEEEPIDGCLSPYYFDDILDEYLGSTQTSSLLADPRGPSEADWAVFIVDGFK